MYVCVQFFVCILFVCLSVYTLDSSRTIERVAVFYSTVLHLRCVVSFIAARYHEERNIVVVTSVVRERAKQQQNNASRTHTCAHRTRSHCRRSHLCSLAGREQVNGFAVAASVCV